MLHRSWVHPPQTAEAWRRWLVRCRDPRYEAYLLRDGASGAPAGVFVLSEIVRGPLQSAFLGYYALVPYAAGGHRTRGMRLLLREAFTTLRLHRVEANIQPTNVRSIALVERCGFRREGFSPRYLKLGGRWRDHERWAILREDWRRPGRRAR